MHLRQRLTIYDKQMFVIEVRDKLYPTSSAVTAFSANGEASPRTRYKLTIFEKNNKKLLTNYIFFAILYLQ